MLFMTDLDCLNSNYDPVLKMPALLSLSFATGSWIEREGQSRLPVHNGRVR
jgi:hypothetical protein